MNDTISTEVQKFRYAVRTKNTKVPLQILLDVALLSIIEFIYHKYVAQISLRFASLIFTVYQQLTTANNAK
jgi:hypothetical protein